MESKEPKFELFPLNEFMKIGNYSESAEHAATALIYIERTYKHLRKDDIDLAVRDLGRAHWHLNRYLATKDVVAIDPKATRQ